MKNCTFSQAQKYRFSVFSTVEHKLLRFYLLGMVILFFFLYIRLSFAWLLAVSILLSIMVSCILVVLGASVSFSTEGITLKYGFRKVNTLQWNDILCCGTFSLVILGSNQENQYLYFSSKPVSYSELVNKNTLPKLSNSFIFIANQPGIYEELTRYWDSNKMKAIPTYNCGRKKTTQRFQSPYIFYVLFWIVLVLSIVLFPFTKDYRWLITAIISIVFLLFIKYRK